MSLIHPKSAAHRGVSRRLSFGCKLILCLTIACCATALGQSSANSTSRTDIEQWIHELDSDNFTTRQDATQKLIDIGRPAIELLKDAAIAGSLEQAVRAVRVLRQLHRSDDVGVRTEAESALISLRTSPRRSVVRRAAAALEENAIWRRQNDPAVVAAAHWSQVHSEASHQILQTQLEVRETLDEMRRISAAGLSPADDVELVESLRETTRRMGRARLNLVRAAIHGVTMTNDEGRMSNE